MSPYERSIDSQIAYLETLTRQVKSLNPKQFGVFRADENTVFEAASDKPHQRLSENIRTVKFRISFNQNEDVCGST
jgi:hypothetical protein